MAEDDVERQVRQLRVESAETRWLALSVDNDVREIRQELRSVRQTQDEHTARFDAVDARFDAVEARLNEHGARFDSVDMQLRSLTQLVGTVLERLPESKGEQPPA